MRKMNKWEEFKEDLFGAVNLVRYGFRTNTKYSELENNKGKIGEFRIFHELEKVKVHHHTALNVYLPKKNGYPTEVDVIYINPKGVYIIESKNFRGWIFGDATSNKWMQMLNPNHRQQFLNPIWQNLAHMEAIQKFLSYIQPEYMHNFVVFGENCEIKKMILRDSKAFVMYRHDLAVKIQQDLDHLPTVFSNELIDVTYRSIENLSLKISKEEHIKKLEKRHNSK